MWLDIRVHKEAKLYQPYLNGEKLKNCFAANEEEGWVDIYLRDPDDHYILNEDKKSLKTTRLTGKVVLVKII